MKIPQAEWFQQNSSLLLSLIFSFIFPTYFVHLFPLDYFLLFFYVFIFLSFFLFSFTPSFLFLIPFSLSISSEALSKFYEFSLSFYFLIVSASAPDSFYFLLIWLSSEINLNPFSTHLLHFISFLFLVSAKKTISWPPFANDKPKKEILNKAILLPIVSVFNVFLMVYFKIFIYRNLGCWTFLVFYM